MKQRDDLKNISNNLNGVVPKWELSINQAGKDAGISYFQIMQVVSEQLKPTNVGTYMLDNKEWELTFSYKEQIT
ncbi:hypothetical protein ABEW50_07640 [Paenibacillus jamilae]